MNATKTSTPKNIIATDETAKLLLAAVQANPRDPAAEMAFADRLTECGANPKTAQRFARDQRLNFLPMLEWDAASRIKFLRGTSVEAIEAALAAANGKRRERILQLNDVLRACKRARRDGYASDGGGTVANSYGYVAHQTGVVVAVASNGKLRVAIDAFSASKGTSVTNRLAGITAHGTADAYRAWADAAQQSSAN